MATGKIEVQGSKSLETWDLLSALKPGGFLNEPYSNQRDLKEDSVFGEHRPSKAWLLPQMNF